MTTPEMIGVAGLLVGIAGGLGGPLLTAVFWGGRITARLAGIEKMLEMSKAEEIKCRADREVAEDKLHGRITVLSEKHQHLKGRMNGGETH